MNAVTQDVSLFRLMADHSPVMLWKAGTNAECDFFNQRWLEFTGRTLAQELGVGWAGGVHPEDFAACMDTYMLAFVAHREFRMEYRLRRADGAFRWILDHGVPYLGADGSFLGFIGSCIDITDKMESEAQARELAAELRTRLDEREVLLREVHHRVKNNLQLICSMHNLQARGASAETRAQLEDAQRRVRSIALVHERLSEQSSLVEVDFQAYVREAIRMIAQTTHETGRIDVGVVGSAPRLQIDQAIPCGLLVTELVTNAVKHAFPGERAGSVRVELTEKANDRLRISVQDDGRGMPDHIDLERPESTGLDLIRALARQLDARLERVAGPGTRMDVEFHIHRELAHG